MKHKYILIVLVLIIICTVALIIIFLSKKPQNEVINYESTDKSVTIDNEVYNDDVTIYIPYD